MAEKTPLLSICIPTYNRSVHLYRLLLFIHEELSALPDDVLCGIEVVVSNNCSTDDTDGVIQSLLKKSYPVRLVYGVNSVNIGGDRNFIKAIELAHADYVWLMGDDDEYRKGLIFDVYRRLNNSELSYIFINHRLLLHGRVEDASVLNGINGPKSNVNFIIDLVAKNPGPLLFISASVHKRKNIIELVQKGLKINMATTLQMALYSASKGVIDIIEDPSIDDECGDVAWASKMEQVFNIDIPYALRRMGEFGYDKKWKQAYMQYLIGRGLVYSWRMVIKKSLKSPRWFVGCFKHKDRLVNPIIW